MKKNKLKTHKWIDKQDWLEDSSVDGTPSGRWTSMYQCAVCGIWAYGKQGAHPDRGPVVFEDEAVDGPLTCDEFMVKDIIK